MKHNTDQLRLSDLIDSSTVLTKWQRAHTSHHEPFQNVKKIHFLSTKLLLLHYIHFMAFFQDNHITSVFQQCTVGLFVVPLPAADSRGRHHSCTSTS